MRLSNSKIKTWRRCPRKFEYKYVKKLRPKKKQLTLERGTWLHSLLETHYNGDNWKVKHKELTREFMGYFPEEREDLGDLPGECKRIMRAYLNKWAIEDQYLTPVDTELDEIIELPNGIRLHIVVDLIMEDHDGILWPFDHKSRKKFGDHDDMVLDPQLTLYFRGLELMGYAPLGGVVYNELRTKPPTIPQLLKRGGLSQRMNIDCDFHTYLTEIRRHELNPRDYRHILLHLKHQEEKFFRRTVLPKDPPQVRQMMKEVGWTANEITRAQDTNEFPRTFEARNCKWDCEYLDMCIVEMHGGDASNIIKQDFEVSKRGD